MEYSFQSVSHDTEREAAIHSAVVFLTAAGKNSVEQALDYHSEGAQANIEAAPDDWEYTGRWSDVWDAVENELESM